jgi:hypothetical protein
MIARFLLLGLLFFGCDADPMEKSLRAYLDKTYSGESFEIVQNRKSKSKQRFLLQHNGDLFAIYVARIAPYPVVEDRYPDLVVRRLLENALSSNEIVAVVDLELEAKARESIDLKKPNIPSSGVKKSDLYLSIAATKPADEFKPMIEKAIATLRGKTSSAFDWEVNFYDPTADDGDLRYRTILNLGVMDQSGERYPQSEKIDLRWRGESGDDPLKTMKVSDLKKARAENQKANDDIKKRMKELEQK